MTNELVAAADTLRSLHRPGHPVVFANVWDAASAELVEAAGFPAIATSSAAVAEAIGHTDHQGAPADEMLAAAGRIARAVSVPVTVDAEAGYGLSADNLVQRLLAAGAVGLNLEDTDHAAGGRRMVDVRRQAEWLADVRAAAERAGVPVVINARIDVVVMAGRPADEQSLVEPIVERATAYLAAGADCVYPILLHTPAAIRQVVAAVAPAPVNVTCAPDRVEITAAAELGVARVSMGGGLWRVVLAGLAERLAVLAAD
ncbi:MAG TPA: isocitrate lyase/phosphoenolpyruvate mutase family protein [Pseudonocardiaceae bacterium]|jgi:2-methylisocitrate lyase-like PEP mutase family enzyme|nr:isocitrate lyase/phosphoenolpyruvate mutase family protein [Pseudonocardiaceae bacterium]